MKVVVSRLSGFCLLFAFSVAWANGMRVSPVRIELSEKKPVAVLTVKNPTDQTLIVQSELMGWTQINGNDSYKSSKDILVVPPLFSIPPHKHQVMRLALSRKNTSELSYRLYLKEIPTQEKKEKKGLQMSLRISIPVFVMPLDTPHEKFDWETKISQKEVVTTLHNNGNITLFIDRLQLFNSQDEPLSTEQKVFKYLLPQQAYQWKLATQNNAIGHCKVKARINGNEVTSEAKISS